MACTETETESETELLADLTDAQRQAVTHVNGPLLIIAAAGSGKTRVITRRVAYLISQGIAPAAILAITFTNKAAGEMKSRVSTALGRPLHDFGRLDQRWPTICTFHSLGLRVLRHFSAEMGLPPNFTIFDSSDQTRLIKDALKLLDLSTTNFAPGPMHGIISNAKNQLITADGYATHAKGFYETTVARVFKKYQKLLDKNNGLDFDDLLLKTTLAMRDHPAVLQQLQDRFTHILIDEYQDTNHAQYVLAHALAMRHRNLCVVGDPDQSIYAWRGADIKNILDFETDYPDAAIVKLEQNYRSTKTILGIAGELIKHNTRRKKKDLFTDNPHGEKAQLLYCPDEYEEARIVARELKKLAETDGYTWNQMAVFYRMNAFSRVMEDALRKENLPYVIARGTEFYGRKEIKDTLAYLRVISNPNDEVSLSRIVNVPARGIGDASMKQVQAFAVANGLSLFAGLEQAASVPGLSSRAINAMATFTKLLRQWRDLAQGSAASDDLLSTQKGPVQQLMEDVVRRSGLEAYYKKEGDEDQNERANIDQLITSAAEFDRDTAEGTLDEYLANISLVTDMDHLKGNGGAITMMTLHAAKGLEFPVVAMIGLEDGALPHSRAREDANQMEEERRLCFVGITRAEQRLILTYAMYRTIRGIKDRTVRSQFLNEMPAGLIEMTDYTQLPKRGRADAFSSHSPHIDIDQVDTSGKFHTGQRVRHPTFGMGKIAELTPMGQQTRAVVQFDRAGRKTLIVEYARLAIVG